MKRTTRLLTSGLLLAVAAAFGLPGAARAQTYLWDIGTNAPATGPYDIFQLNWSHGIADTTTPSSSIPGTISVNQNGTLTSTIDYSSNQYYKMGAGAGQSFLTGPNPSGYVLNSLSVATIGNGNNYNNQSYGLIIYTVTNNPNNLNDGGTSTVVTNLSTYASSLAEKHWWRWTNLGVTLQPSTLYAYSFWCSNEANAYGGGWERLGSSIGNPYSAGMLALIQTNTTGGAAGGLMAGGKMDYGTNYDATFVLGLSAINPTATPPIYVVDPAIGEQHGATAAIAAVPFTVSSGASVLVVTLADRTTVAGSAPAALAYGTQTLTRLVTTETTAATMHDATIYYLYNPTPGTASISGTFSNAPTDYYLSAYTLAGVDTTVAPLSGGTNSVSATGVGISLTGVTGGSYAAVCGTYSNQCTYMLITNNPSVTMDGEAILDRGSYRKTTVTMGYMANLSAGSDALTYTLPSGGGGSGNQPMTFVAGVFAPAQVNARIGFVNGSGYTNNFDWMGVTNTAMPAGFRALGMAGNSGTFTNGAPITSNAVATAVQGPNTLGIWNPGNTNFAVQDGLINAGSWNDTNNRALATSPLNDAGTVIELALTNNTGTWLSSVSFGYNLKVLTNGSAGGDSSELPGYSFFYSITGSANGADWVYVPSLSLNGSTQGTTYSSGAQTIAFPAPLTSGATVYFRWADDNNSFNNPNQMIAIDDISIVTNGIWTQPIITAQPVSGTLYATQTTNFSVVAVDLPGDTLSYQWRTNGVSLSNVGEFSGATTPTLTVTGASYRDATTYSVVVTDTGGSATTSSIVTLTVLTPAPVISMQPAPRTAYYGSATNFTVTASDQVGSALSYQWLTNGVPISNRGDMTGATTATLSFSSLVFADANSYSVAINNGFGQYVTSSVVTLIVLVPSPVITTQPVSKTLYSGMTANFTVIASDPSSTWLSYQWQRNGTALANGDDISGATTNNLAISDVSSGNTGNYRVVISNAWAAVTSSVVTLAVLAPDNVASAVLGLNPVAFYELNEIANPASGGQLAFDYVGNRNGAYMVNAQNGFNNIAGPQPPVFQGFSITNTALKSTYNLNNSFVGLPGLNIIGNTATIVAWINPSGAHGESSAGLVFNTRDAGGGSGTNTCGFGFAQSSPNGQGQYPLGGYWNNNTWQWSTSGLYPPTNQWSMAAMVVTPTNITLYLMNTNGIQSAVTNVNNTQASWMVGGTNYIGTDPYSTPGRTYDGGIDDVAFFNYSLTQAQLTSLFGAGVGGGGGSAPLITQEPQPQIVYPAGTANFTVVASDPSGAGLSYQWRTNGTALTDGGNLWGSTTNSLTITNVSSGNVGSYSVVITNVYGAVTSTVVTLTLTNPPPQISVQPVSLAVGVGQTAQLSVSATGSGTLSYQWMAGAIGSGVYTNLTDGGNISGSGSATLSINNAGEWNAADYIVVISVAGGGAVTSHVATLTVGTWEQAGQGGAVTAVATSPDGLWIASGSDDTTVKLWRAGDGALVRTLGAGGLPPVSSLAFGPSGTNIAAGYYDGSIRVWIIANGALDRTFVLKRNSNGSWFTNVYGKVSALAFSPDGSQIASGGGDWLTRIWQLSSGTILNGGGVGAVENDGVVRSLAYSPDGNSLVVAGEDTNLIKQIYVLNGKSPWNTITTLSQGSNNISSPCSNAVTSVAFSPDGSTLVSGCLDQTISFWQTSGWGLLRTVTNTGPGVTSLAFGANGQTLFSGDQNGAITLWSASASPSWSATRSWAAHAGPVWSLACATDNSKLVSGGDDHQVVVWRTADGTVLMNLTSHAGVITRTCFAPDGSLVASASTDGSLRLWAADTGVSGSPVAIHTNQISALAFSPDATLLASGGGVLDNTIRIWSCANYSLLLTVPANTNGVTALAISPDSSLIASGGDRSEQAIKLWNAGDGSLARTIAGHTNGTTVLAFSPNGQYLASGGGASGGQLPNDSVRLWNPRDGSLVQAFAGHTCNVASVSFNMTGGLLASAGEKDGLVNVWKTSDGTLVTSLSQWARSVAFSPDGTLLAAAGSDSIQMWRTSDWQPVWSCAQETVGISTLSFSPNGAYLVFGRDDGTVCRIWNPLAAPVNLALSFARGGHLTIANPSYSPFLTVHVSPDLKSWGVLTNVVAATNLVQVLDPSSSPPRVRFYRVSAPE